MAVRVLDDEHPIEAFWRAQRDGEDIELATSGTTSNQPRIIRRSVDSWVKSFDSCARRLELTADSRFWIPGPMAATMNFFSACLADYVGATWSTSIEGTTHAQLTPTGLGQLLDSGRGAGMHVLAAGDGLHPPLRDRARAAGFTVSHYYGTAELSLVAWGSASDDLHLFDDVEAEVRDGILWARSPWLSRVQTDERGFASVGDLAVLDGDHLTILGRPGAVTTGGATVELATIEHELRAQAQGPVVVVGIPHPRLGTVVCAITKPDDLDAVRSWARANLTAGRRPRRWSTRQTFPTTSAGKIDRNFLRNELMGESAGGDVD